MASSKSSQLGLQMSPSLFMFCGYIAFLFSKIDGVLIGASHDELNVLFPEYEIIHPSVVSAGGEFITHDLLNAEFFTEQRHHSRKRRSVKDADTIEVAFIGETIARRYNHSIDVRNDVYRESVEGPIEIDGTELGNSSVGSQNWSEEEPLLEVRRLSSKVPHRYLHFNVSVFGASLQLKVEKKQSLIAPGAKSVIFFEDGRRVEKVLSSSCMFFGVIPNHPRSKVAISNCNGLSGLIQTDNDEFYIEPIDDRSRQQTERSQRHVIYKRSPKAENIGKRMEKERARQDFKQSRIHESLSSSVESLLEKQKDSIRRKRHVKRNDYNIEILLTADNEVVEFHGRENVENYLLTLINIVDEIYHDTSLGEHVNMVLSRLYQLDERRSNNLIKNENPAVSLKNVCKWAHRMYETDPPSHGRLPDHSIFLTRKNFGPAGYAHVSGMCQPLRSCSLTFEDGFSSAFVVAHETGHVLGMEHDGEGNRCGDETSMGSIMAPLVQAAFHRYHWSRCSQQELRMNLRDFRCLSDDPHSPDWGPVPVFPGVTYTMDDQCRFDFGQGYKRCTAFRNMDVCKTLWCSHDENPLFCKTKKGPPVDGTECGTNMWCFKSHCVWRDQRHRSTNGNWGAWSAYTECSRSCGTGVMYRSRLCDNPAPSKGGADCTGKNVDYDLCSKRPCPGGGDFRADQCMYRNNEVEFKNQRHSWLPYEPLATDLKCDLYCVSKKTQDVVTMGDFVSDGTQCSYDDPHGICIRGECVEVGCDRIIGSRGREDICGNCGGDGSSCHNITDKLTKKVNRKTNSYIKLLKIPAGSRHLRIQEMPGSYSTNLLALKSRSEKRYLLNGKSKRISAELTPHRWISAGALWTYENSGGVETINTRGPISSDIMLMLLIHQRNTKVSIAYSYVLQENEVPKSRDTYRYEIKRWTSCSVTCGSGYRRAKYGCKSEKKRKWVSKKKCKGRPPRTGRRSSNVQPCNVECRTPSRWVSGEWGECSKSCGSDGWQEREVTCQRANTDGETEAVSEQRCLAEQKPSFRQICHSLPCPPQWRTGPWSPCSTTCGQGEQRRQIRCRALGRSVATSQCSVVKPNSTQPCEERPCEAASRLPTRSTLAATTELSSTEVSLITDNCEKQEPIFCGSNAMAQYCSLSGFKKLCCKSCRQYQASLIEDRPSGVEFSQESEMEKFVSNGTLQNMLLRNQESGTNGEILTDETNHQSSTLSSSSIPTTSPFVSTTGPTKPNSRDEIQLRRKRSISDAFGVVELEKESYSRSPSNIKTNRNHRICSNTVQCRKIMVDGLGPRTNFRKCRGIPHRKVFPRSNGKHYVYCDNWILSKTPWSDFPEINANDTEGS